MTPWRLIEFAELDSTNRYAREHLAELSHGDAVRADVQTAGRGRQNRTWISHIPGNLCLSLVLKPDSATLAQLPLANLSQLLAVCTCHVLENCQTTPTLKWPNDVQLGGRKIAGILAETTTQGTDFLGLVLGIGVNLNLDAATLATIEQPATSLSMHLNRTIPVHDFCTALLQEFFAYYDSFMNAGFGLIREDFLQRSPFLGSQIRLCVGSRTLHAIALDVNQEGALVIKDPLGQVQVVSIAEMFN